MSAPKRSLDHALELGAAQRQIHDLVKMVDRLKQERDAVMTGSTRDEAPAASSIVEGKKKLTGVWAEQKALEERKARESPKKRKGPGECWLW